MYLQTPYKISYDIQKYDFRKIVSEMLEVWEGDTIPLEDLHTLEHYDLFVREKDQSTIWHKRYYEKYKEQFLPTYLKLVKELKDQGLPYKKILREKYGVVA